MDFPDLTTTSVWYSSKALITNITYKQGPTKQEITPEEMTEMGASQFMFRLHLLPETESRTCVWLTALPGTKETIGPKLKALLSQPSFPVLFYKVKHKSDSRKLGANLNPPPPPRTWGPTAWA